MSVLIETPSEPVETLIEVPAPCSIAHDDEDASEKGLTMFDNTLVPPVEFVECVEYGGDEGLVLRGGRSRKHAKVSPEDIKHTPLTAKSVCCGIISCTSVPFRFVYHSLNIYCMPCICVMCSYALVDCCCNRVFQDPKFPANHKSIGDWHDLSAETIDSDYQWLRGKDIVERKEITLKDGTTGLEEVRLFQDTIRPEDIVQGQLGDCWLLTAFSCLAEFGETIRKCFKTKAYNPLGKYEVQLYDPSHKKWVIIEVDDRFPAKDGKPIFASPKGNQLWVLVLEKAFAKFCGSYAALAGGVSAWAFEVRTNSDKPDNSD